jgi:hypothetical protein
MSALPATLVPTLGILTPRLASGESSDASTRHARSMRIEDEVGRRGIQLRRSGNNEYCGPCPKCGGRDRFSINTRKQLFNCRGCRKGGDVIELVKQRCVCELADALNVRGIDIFIEGVAP